MSSINSGEREHSTDPNWQPSPRRSKVQWGKKSSEGSFFIFSKGGLKSESRKVIFKISAKNYPGIEKMKILTFFAFTGLISLQVLQIGSRSITN